VVRDALVRRGIDAVHADATARGLSPIAVVFDDIPSDISRTLIEVAGHHGLELSTGDDWVMLAGSAARLAGLARPDVTTLPSSVSEELGRALAGLVDPPHRWVTARGSISLDRPVVVGILNVTPDSFSDGGQFLDADAALCHAAELVAAGANMLDVGAESTRPGRPEPVPADEEWRRLEPVVREIARRFPEIPISVDTVKAETARRALEAGAWAVNDVSGLRLDPQIAEICSGCGAGLILMHSRGTTRDMATYQFATYRNVMTETVAELSEAVARAESRGVMRDHIVLDPGLGFAKTPEQSLEVLRGVSALVALGFPVMVGPSRKRFLGVAARRDVAAGDRATAAACVAAYLSGASFFRVHDARGVREALDVAHAIGGPHAV
jgi:dihydropteroate synthase